MNGPDRSPAPLVRRITRRCDASLPANGERAASWLAQLDEYASACEALTVEERKAWDGEAS